MISFIQKNLYTCFVIYIVNIIEFRLSESMKSSVFRGLLCNLCIFPGVLAPLSTFRPIIWKSDYNFLSKSKSLII